MIRSIVIPGVLLAIATVGCNREHAHLAIGETIKPGMSFQTVYQLLGDPDVGWGLPQAGSKETSDLYYAIPGDQYLVIHFVGDRVADPATTKEPRSELIEMR
jgi:hypothetical protein